MFPNPRIVVIHTSPATVELFGRLLRNELPAARISNILDDSILPELRDNGGDIATVARRWEGYARTACELGADLILNACSSIGELCAPVEQVAGVPIVRVDAALAREAVRRGGRVAVVATLQSTLRPTCTLLEVTARSLDVEVLVDAQLVAGAYPALMAGDQAGHDDMIVAALRESAARADVVVLAQASMARVLPRLTAEAQAKVLASPPLAVADVVRRVRELR